MVVKGHYDGTHVVLDEPVPQNIRPQTPVRVLFDNDREPCSLDRIAELASPGGMPPDYSEQHEHYVKGTPRR